MHHVSLGDWLKMINGEVVTAKTLDQILLHIAPPTTVILNIDISGLRICVT